MNPKLIEINTIDDIPSVYRDTPISLLLEYQNLDRQFEDYTNAKLLIGMCMDNRKHLRIPTNFAYIIRAGGANLRYSEFKVSFAISIGKVKHIALIGHNNCGMVNLESKKEEFISGLVEYAGWDLQTAEDHFKYYAPHFEVGDAIDFVEAEAKRLRLRYPGIEVVPMHYLVESNKIYLIKES